MLETIREYGLEQLTESGEVAALRDAHLAWAVTFAERTSPTVHGPGSAPWLRLLDVDHDNLRAALAWALERKNAEAALRLGGALRDFWYLRGHNAEGRRWLEAGLAIGADAPAAVRARALLGVGWLANF
ncbi:MAG: hypothetical protein AVDCRST_MAG73-646 [uncultured Thermomicrobiales bacterium]|uniref:Uncharacterized protein n=1 Tax=uncultured Thermomicrobiales bacterium TaxID=1645740 RepID=A0A6J4TP18_9BACT|nr:MAG: hypothetical protein AVDCRST_MAG73-646 [uncultured Thermomicrobiales bacterium]